LRKPTDERIAGIEIRCPRTVVASSRSEWNTAPRGRNITSSNTSTLRSAVTLEPLPASNIWQMPLGSRFFARSRASSTD